MASFTSFSRARNNEIIAVREPDTQVTPTFIDDICGAVAAILRAAKLPRERVFNLAAVEASTYQQLAERVRNILGSASAIEIEDASRQRNRVLDTTRIRSVLGFTPLPLAEHLVRFSGAR